MLICSALFLLASYSCSEGTANVVIKNNSGTVYSSIDKPITDYQDKLLDIAFEISSKISVKPHIKDRSRAQEAVVKASLKLDQPLRALRYIDRIDNWRRGSCYADLAFYCATNGYTDKIEQYLDLASQIFEDTEGWRKDQIRAKIAKTYTWMGQTQQANQFNISARSFERGEIVAVKAIKADKDSFDKQVKELEELIAPGNFDMEKNVLKAYTHLFDRFYDNEKRRSGLETKIKTSWDKIPIFARIELLADLAASALGHGDQKNALELINEAQVFIDGAQWSPEYKIKLMAKLAKLRFQAGDIGNAKTHTDDLQIFFDTQRNNIVNIYRAGALRPIAEVYQLMGDTTAALKVYKKAIDEGVVNPNSRPRAEDLSASCLSMALYKVEPGAKLYATIRQINEKLGAPW